jgi:hypothetical protein
MSVTSANKQQTEDPKDGGTTNRAGAGGDSGKDRPNPPANPK